MQDAITPIIERYTEYIDRLKAEESLYEFVKQAWPYVEGKRPYIDGWHMQALCEHLEALNAGQILRLLVNMPPRCSKSLVMCVFFPAWVFIRHPDTRFLCGAHSYNLAARDSGRCRRLIMSEWYQARWGERYYVVKGADNKRKFENNHGGYRECTSVDSRTTGQEGDILILDDPNNAKDAASDLIRNNVNEFFSAGWSTRLANPTTSRMLVGQQRTDVDDVSGHVLKNDEYGEWLHLKLPMEYESETPCKTISLPSSEGKIWKDPRKKEGELLWPNFIGEKQLRSIKRALINEYKIAGQLQQRPAPAEGGLLKKSYFQWWKHPLPKFIQIIQSWDTALSAEETKDNSYSACTTWGLFKDDNDVLNLILLNMWLGRVEYPDLRRLAIRFSNDYRDDGSKDYKADELHKPHFVLVEQKASGYSLIHDFKRAGIYALKFDPKKHGGDKITRVKLSSPIIESGRVWLPTKGPDHTTLKDYARKFLELASIFPAKESRDVVDTMSQVLLRLINGKLLSHPQDEDLGGGDYRPDDVGYPVEKRQFEW